MPGALLLAITACSGPEDSGEAPREAPTIAELEVWGEWGCFIDAQSIFDCWSLANGYTVPSVSGVHALRCRGTGCCAVHTATGAPQCWFDAATPPDLPERVVSVCPDDRNQAGIAVGESGLLYMWGGWGPDTASEGWWHPVDDLTVQYADGVFDSGLSDSLRARVLRRDGEVDTITWSPSSSSGNEKRGTSFGGGVTDFACEFTSCFAIDADGMLKENPDQSGGLGPVRRDPIKAFDLDEGMGVCAVLATGEVHCVHSESTAVDHPPEVEAVPDDLDPSVTVGRAFESACALAEDRTTLRCWPEGGYLDEAWEDYLAH